MEEEKSTPFEWANSSYPLSLTSDFILPHEKRPKLSNNIQHLDHSIIVPLIDLNENDNFTLVQQVSNACQEFGFFQIINHGIPNDLCTEVLKVITGLFQLPRDEKTRFSSTHHMEDGKIFHYYVNDQENKKKIAMWMEAFFHTWHPDDSSYVTNLPEIPLNFREVIGAYGEKMGNVMTRILRLMSQGLGLDKEHLTKIIEQNNNDKNNTKYTAQANYYPPCPDPNLTLGLQPHTDINILTVLLQDQGVGGLQVLNHGHWLTIHPIPGALIVNVADQLQVLSNDKYKSVHHRAVNNEDRKRVSYAMFCGLNMESIVSPIQDLVNEHHPPLYRSYTFAEFIEEFRKQEGQTRMVKEVFKLK